MILLHKIFKSVYLPFRYITLKSCSYEGCLKGFMKGRKFRFSDPKTPGCWIWEKSTKYQKTANSLELMTVFSCHNGCASFCIIMLSNSKWHFWFFCNFQAKCCLQNKHAEHFLNLMSSAEVNCIARSVLWWNRDGRFPLIVAAQMWAPNCFLPSFSLSRLQLCCVNLLLCSGEWSKTFLLCCFSTELTVRQSRIAVLLFLEHFPGEMARGRLPHHEVGAPAQDRSRELRISPLYQPSLGKGEREKRGRFCLALLL